MANEAIDELQHWQYRKVADVHLYAHPDLEVTAKKSPSTLVLMLGYIFDPTHPDKTNEEIISDVMSSIGSFQDLIAAIKPFAGRYAIIYKDVANLMILHDPLGLREIYYCKQPNKVICGSQPNLLLRFAQPILQKSTDPLLLDFVNVHLPRVRNGRLWVGDGTPYEGIKHLLPNHCLDIFNLVSRRYWPNTPLSRIELDKAIRKCAAFLQGAMKAAALRQPLMMAVTAGLDSRTLLAASKEISSSVYYFINKHDRFSERSNDIRIPKEIFRRIGIPFHVHQIPKAVPEEFKRVFFDNSFYAKQMILPVIYNIYYKQHSNKMNITGVGEVGRTKFYDEPKKLTPYYLAYMLRYRRSPYAVRECELWLSRSKSVAHEYGLNIMTLFWWEVLIGNWGSVGNSESDIAIEEFDPYASHLLYETFLSIDPENRTYKDNILFEELIKAMWPELLSVPHNPPESIKGLCIWALHKLGIEMPLRMLKFRLFSFCYHSLWKSKKTHH